MKHLHFSLSAFLVALLPVVALAQTVSSGQQFPFDDISVGAYTDSPWDLQTNVAVSALTRMGVVVGNDDGTFAPDRRLNRAEFVTIVMRLLSDNDPISLNCFPDVPPNAWYAEDVCRAKAIGLIRGNAVAGIDATQWRFEPARDIQYEEAIKILVELYALPTSGDTEGSDWYVPYIRAAQTADVDLSGRVAGDHITRGEMASLTIAFVAESQDRLDELRDAERGSSSSTSRSSSSRSSSSQSSVSSSSSSTGSGVFDPDDDVSLRSRILLLGQVSPVIASIKLFSNSEPVDVSGIDINLNVGVKSVGSLLIYDENGEQIGTATSVGGSATHYRASIGFGRMLLPYREERRAYIRARLKSDEAGGVSGGNIQVQSVIADGEGRWSSEEYAVTSTDTFPLFQSALARITGVSNNLSSQDILIPGTEHLLADFTVEAETPESQHQVELESLTFNIERPSDVTLSDVELRNEDSSVVTPCSVVSDTLVCDAIDASIGTVDTSRRMRVYGDIAIGGSSADPYLRLVLNQPGAPTVDGAIEWSDGDTTFTWVDLGQPVFQATNWQ